MQHIDLLYTEYPGTSERDYIEYLEGVCHNIEQGEVELVKELLDDSYGFTNKISSKVMFMRLCQRMKNNLFWRDDFTGKLREIIGEGLCSREMELLILDGIRVLLVSLSENVLFNLIVTHYNTNDLDCLLRIRKMVNEGEINTDFMASLHLMHLYFLNRLYGK